MTDREEFEKFLKDNFLYDTSGFIQNEAERKKAQDESFVWRAWQARGKADAKRIVELEDMLETTSTESVVQRLTIAELESSLATAKQALNTTQNPDEWIRKSDLETSGYPLIRLGYGKVEVGTGEVEGEPVILFTNHGTGVIGDNTVAEPRVNEPKDVYAAISITSIDSLNVVRKQLDIFAKTYLSETTDTAEWIRKCDLEAVVTAKDKHFMVISAFMNVVDGDTLYRIRETTK